MYGFKSHLKWYQTRTDFLGTGLRKSFFYFCVGVMAKYKTFFKNLGNQLWIQPIQTISKIMMWKSLKLVMIKNVYFSKNWTFQNVNLELGASILARVLEMIPVRILQTGLYWVMGLSLTDDYAILIELKTYIESLFCS